MITKINGVQSAIVRGTVIWSLVVVTLAYYIIKYRGISMLGFRQVCPPVTFRIWLIPKRTDDNNMALITPYFIHKLQMIPLKKISFAIPMPSVKNKLAKRKAAPSSKSTPATRGEKAISNSGE